MKFIKTCKVCKQSKSSEEFYKHQNTKDLLRSECIDCWNNLSLKYYSEHKEHINQINKRNHFKRNYGLSLEELNSLKDEQNRQCLICLQIEELVVDHDHMSNKFRGLLCSKCNQGLGSFKDSVDNLERAISYLRRNR